MSVFVQAAVGAADSPSAVTGTGGTGFGSSTVTGNAIIVGVSWGSTGTGQTVTDNKSNTYTLAGSVITGNSRSIAIYYCLSITGGAGHTVTLSVAGTFDLQIIAHEVDPSGALTFDQFVSDNAEAGTPVDTPALTPASNGAYLFGHVRACAASGQTFAPNTGTNAWVEQGEVNFGGDSDSQAQYFIQPTAASIACEWTMSSTGNAICCMAAFLDSSVVANNALMWVKG